MRLNLKKGISLVEIIISVSILLSFVIAVVAGISFYLKVSSDNTEKLKATFLLEEGVEAVKILRDTGWSENIESLSVGNNYYLNWNGTTYESTTSPLFVDGKFDRYFVLESVYRDSNDDIATSGTLDSNTLKLTVFVDWNLRGSTTSESVPTYIIDLYEN